MGFALRKNQVQPIRETMGFLRENNPQPGVVVMPTASGKSVILAESVKNSPGKTIIMQPGIELLSQNYKKYTQHGHRAAIYSASMGQKDIDDTTFASLPSIYTMGPIFKRAGFKSLLIDEVHLYSNEKTGTLQRFIEESGIKRVLGFTASPLKLQTVGGKGSFQTSLVMLTEGNSFFKNMIHVGQVSDMVENNWWCPLLYENHTADLSALRFNEKGDDYTERSMQETYRLNNTGEKILAKIASLKDRKHILVSVPSVAEARALSALCHSSTAVWGEMKPHERDAATRGFLSGRTRVAFVVGVWTCGFDFPGLDCLIMGRSTSSFAFFYQFIGRGTRILPNIKENCLIVDYSGNLDKFGQLEYIQYTQENGSWKLYGQNDTLLTGIPLTEIGKHKIEQINKARKLKAMPSWSPGEPITFFWGDYKGKLVSEVTPIVRDWYLANSKWGDKNRYVMEEILRLKNG